MSRLAALAIIVLVLAAASACHRDTWHWLTPVPPVTIEPHVAPPKGWPPYIPTVTPTPSIEYKCECWHIRDCELRFSAGEL